MKTNFLKLFLSVTLLQLCLVNALESHKTGNIYGVRDFHFLTITAITATQCSLQVYWDCDSRQAPFDGFNVFWQQNGSQDVESVLVSRRSNNHNINGLISDQSFTIWVALVFHNFDNFSSDPVETSTLKGEPVKVTGVNAEQVSDSVIHVSWDETSNTCPIQGYRVTWNGTTKWDSTIKPRGDLDTDVYALDVDNLQPYTVYDFYVSEITTDGLIGEPSDPARAETKQGAACPPEPVTSSTLDSYRAQVNWSFPEATNGVITGYHISCQILPDTTDDCDITITNANIFTANIEGLKACGNYTFTVQAINGYEDGYGEPGKHISRTDPEPPPNIARFSLENLTSTSVVFTWEPLLTNCPVLKYDLHGEEVVLWNNQTDSFDIAIPGEDNCYLIENLTPYSFYNISFKATTEGGSTAPVWQEFLTLEDVAEAPEFLEASTLDSSTVVLNWGPSTAIKGKLDGYLVCYRSEWERIYECQATAFENTLSYVVSGLDACLYYVFTVQAVNGVGTGNKVSITTNTKAEVPPPIGVVEVTAVNQTNITITFVPPATTCNVLYYEVEGTGVTLCNNEIIEFSTAFMGGNETYLLKNLIPFARYTFNITATTKGGTTTGEIFEAQTEKSVPSAPDNLALDNGTLSENGFGVVWEKPAFQNGVMVQFGVYLFHGAEIIEENIVTYSDENSKFTYLFSQLKSKTTYKVSVAAENDVGVSTIADLQITTL